jgi:hypothetical protein
MGNLEQFMPKDSKTVLAIYALHKRRGEAEPSRGYLGASIIGKKCERYLWYAFRGPWGGGEGFDGRMYRLLQTGDLAEARFVEELRSIGCEVHDRDANGDQFAVFALGGHFSGHMDAAILGVFEVPVGEWAVGEFKTHNAKSFSYLTASGVKLAKPEHFAQMQSYMHLTGMRYALYLAVNKDTDELYSEVVKYIKPFAEGLMAKAANIIYSLTPPRRIVPEQSGFPCKWCQYKPMCYGDLGHVEGPRNCRKCIHARPDTDSDTDAEWICILKSGVKWIDDCNDVCDNYSQVNSF